MSFSDEASILWPKKNPFFLLHVTVNFSVLASQTQRQLPSLQKWSTFKRFEASNPRYQTTHFRGIRESHCTTRHLSLMVFAWPFWTHQANPKNSKKPELHTLLPNPTKKGHRNSGEHNHCNKISDWLKNNFSSRLLFFACFLLDLVQKKMVGNFHSLRLNKRLSVLGRFWRLLVSCKPFKTRKGSILHQLAMHVSQESCTNVIMCVTDSNIQVLIVCKYMLYINIISIYIYIISLYIYIYTLSRYISE